MKKDFKKKISELNLDTLYFLLVVSKKFPKIVKVRKLLGSEAVLSEDTVHDVTEKVMVRFYKIKFYCICILHIIF